MLHNANGEWRVSIVHVTNIGRVAGIATAGVARSGTTGNIPSQLEAVSNHRIGPTGRAVATRHSDYPGLFQSLQCEHVFVAIGLHNLSLVKVKNFLLETISTEGLDGNQSQHFGKLLTAANACLNVGTARVCFDTIQKFIFVLERQQLIKKRQFTQINPYI